MTKILIKWEGDRDLFNLHRLLTENKNWRKSWQRLTRPHRICVPPPWPHQLLLLPFNYNCSSLSGSLGTSSRLPPQGLCTCCSLCQEFCSPVYSSPSPSNVTISIMFPINIRFKMVSSYPCSPHFIFCCKSHLYCIHCFFSYLFGQLSLPPSPH